MLDGCTVPTYMLCPITMEIMLEPVICCDGHTYEREEIERWLKKSARSPLTNLLLANKDLIPNRAIKTCIDMYLESIGRNGLERDLFTPVCPFTPQFEVAFIAFSPHHTHVLPVHVQITIPQVSVTEMTSRMENRVDFYNVQQTTTVQCLKSDISIKRGIGVAQQRLMFKHAELQDEHTLYRDCGVRDGCCLKLVLQPQQLGR